MNKRKPCIYGLHEYCIVYSTLAENGGDVSKWGSVDWVKLHCSMCIKVSNARSKQILFVGDSVVITL